MMHFRGLRQQYREPTFEQYLRKFSNSLKDLISKYNRFPFQLTSQSQIFDQETKRWERLVTLWCKDNIEYEIWCQIGYDYSVATLEICFYLSKNCRITSVTGFYYINLAINLLQRYSNELFYNKQAFQFNINPITGTIKISSKLLVKEQQYQIQIGKPEYICSFVVQLCQLQKVGLKFIQIQEYLQKKVSKCPNITFYEISKNLKNSQQYQPEQFLKAIRKSFRTVNPNCQNLLEAFGNKDASEKFIKAYNQNMVDQISQAVKFYGKAYDQRQDLGGMYIDCDKQIGQMPNQQLTKLLTKIYDASVSEEQSDLTEKVVKKIIIKNSPHTIAWERYATGGFGLIEKAYVEYDLTDFSGLKKESLIGQIVRKSDLRNTNKIAHEMSILQYLKNEEHDHILSYYISDQPLYQGYIFSKFEPNASLQKYLKANRKTISLQSLIRIMESTAKGLTFFQERKVVHLDIKPNNIIITRDLTAKISDFGQAYILKSDKHAYNRGFTIPYMPAERFSFDFTTKIDVYSLGVTMFKILFDGHIWGDINNINKNNFMKCLRENSLKILMTPEKLFIYGVPEIIGTLAKLSLACVSIDPQERPTLFYITSILVFAKFYLHSLIQYGCKPIY